MDLPKYLKLIFYGFTTLLKSQKIFIYISQHILVQLQILFDNVDGIIEYIYLIFDYFSYRQLLV